MREQRTPGLTLGLSSMYTCTITAYVNMHQFLLRYGLLRISTKVQEDGPARWGGNGQRCLLLYPGLAEPMLAHDSLTLPILNDVVGAAGNCPRRQRKESCSIDVLVSSENLGGPNQKSTATDEHPSKFRPMSKTPCCEIPGSMKKKSSQNRLPSLRHLRWKENCSSKRAARSVDSRHGVGPHFQDSPRNPHGLPSDACSSSLGVWAESFCILRVSYPADHDYIGDFISKADTSVVVTSYDLIGWGFDQFSSASWILTSYSLSLCTTQPVLILS